MSLSSGHTISILEIGGIGCDAAKLVHIDRSKHTTVRHGEQQNKDYVGSISPPLVAGMTALDDRLGSSKCYTLGALHTPTPTLT